MSLAEFHDMHRDWTRWNADTEESQQVRHVPASALGLPHELSHVTHYGALPSIRASGLDPNYVNAKTGLNARSGTAKYFKRDAQLRAVYMGTSSDIGASMENEDQTAEGGRVNLTVRVPPHVRRRDFRTAGSVISNQQGAFNDAAPSNTVLGFGKIPPQYLHLTDPQTGKLHPLTSFQPDSRGREYDFTRFATQPSEDNDPLPSNQDLIDSQRRKAALLKSMGINANGPSGH